MKKAVKIIALVLTLSLLVFAIVSYCIWKEQTQQVIAKVVEYINKPLPIVGVSILILAGFVYKCFIATRFGKKALKEYQNALDETKRELAEKEKEIDTTLKDYKITLEELSKELGFEKEILIQQLELSKNVKVQALAKKLKGEETYGEKETHSDQEEETL